MILLSLCIGFGASVTQAQSDSVRGERTADEIVQRYLEKTGIAEFSKEQAWEPYTSETVQTTFMENGKDSIMKHISRICVPREKKLFLKMDSEEKKQRQAMAFDGKEGWIREGAVSLVVKFKQKAFDQFWLASQALVQVPLEFSELPILQRTLGGKKVIRGRRCTAVIISNKQDESKRYVCYFDDETGLLSHSEAPDVETDFLEYQAFGPITICTRQIFVFSGEQAKKTKVKAVKAEIRNVWLGKADETFFCKDAVKNAFK